MLFFFAFIANKYFFFIIKNCKDAKGNTVKEKNTRLVWQTMYKIEPSKVNYIIC